VGGRGRGGGDLYDVQSDRSRKKLTCAPASQPATPVRLLIVTYLHLSQNLALEVPSCSFSNFLFRKVIMAEAAKDPGSQTNMQVDYVISYRYATAG
jgi:hypothetical protein